MGLRTPPQKADITIKWKNILKVPSPMPVHIRPALKAGFLSFYPLPCSLICLDGEPDGSLVESNRNWLGLETNLEKDRSQEFSHLVCWHWNSHHPSIRRFICTRFPREGIWLAKLGSDIHPWPWGTEMDCYSRTHGLEKQQFPKGKQREEMLAVKNSRY